MPDDKKLEQMRAMRAKGDSYAVIGERFGVSRQRVQQIVGDVKVLEPYAHKECEWCEKRFRYEKGGPPRSYCSTKCQKQAVAVVPCPSCDRYMSRGSSTCKRCSRVHDRDLILSVYLGGASTTQIGTCLGVSGAAIAGLIAKTGTKLRKRGVASRSTMTDAQVRKLLGL